MQLGTLVSNVERRSLLSSFGSFSGRTVDVRGYGLEDIYFAQERWRLAEHSGKGVESMALSNQPLSCCVPFTHPHTSTVYELSISIAAAMRHFGCFRSLPTVARFRQPSMHAAGTGHKAGCASLSRQRAGKERCTHRCASLWTPYMSHPVRVQQLLPYKHSRHIPLWT